MSSSQISRTRVPSNLGSLAAVYAQLLVLLCVLAKWQTVMGQEEVTDEELFNKYINSTLPETTTTTEAPTTTTTTTIEANSSCSCVMYYLCNIDNGTVNTDGTDRIDPRVEPKKKLPKSPCTKDYEICCEDLKPNNETSNVPFEDSKKITPVTPSPTFKHSVCGKRNPEGIGLRISGPDTQTQFGEFPWMTAILRRKTDKDKDASNVFLCGGSLIHPQVVLTAAHCVSRKAPSEIKVRFGEWDTQSPNEAYPHVNRMVSKIIIHKDFFAGNLYNDVALLILDNATNLAPNVDTVCLSPTNFDMTGKRCFVTGWGKNGEQGRYQVILKKIEVPVISNSKCQEDLRKTRLGTEFRLHDSFVCAGGEGDKDACQGDGGSPLVCQLPNSPYYIQHGIVAWGIGCANGNPGVYANVPKFLPWITEQFISSQLDTSFYKN